MHARPCYGISTDSFSKDQVKSIISVDTVGNLETLLAQHIFTAFMWAVASDSRLRIEEETSIAHTDQFRIGDPDSLLSLRLENKMLTGIAEAIERTGLASIQDAYFCIVPSLSDAKKLPSGVLVDFVQQQTRIHELSGRWETVVPVYIRLFQMFKDFGTEH